MNIEMFFVFGLLVAAVVLFVTDRLRMDVVALLVLLTLLLTGILSPEEALAGFSHPVVLIIAGLFVVSGALFQTGVASAMGQLLTRISGENEGRLIVVTMGAVALLSAFLSSAGATAVLIPVVVSMAWRARVAASRVLMPLAIGSLVGGLLTLIGTPPNLVVSGELAAHGLDAFRFFTFTPVGLLIWGVAVAFMLLVGRRLLPARAWGASEGTYVEPDTSLSLDDLADAYGLQGNLFLVRVRSSSPLVGRPLNEVALRPRYGVNVIEIQSWPTMKKPPTPARPVEPETLLEHNDILHVQGSAEDITRMAKDLRLGILPQTEEGDEEPLRSDELGMVELLLPPRSRLIGQTLREARFRDKYNLTVLSIRRYGEPLPPDQITDTRLRFGDTLLVLGSWQRIRLLQEERRNFVVVGQPREMLEAQRTPKNALTSTFVMIAMLALMTFEIVPPVTAVLMAAMVMILTGCLTVEQAYEAMNWQSIVLLAGMLPVATALQKTGGVQFIAGTLTAGLGSLGPPAVMAGLFLLTALFSQFISNTATTVLMAPIAYQAAVTLGITPQAYLMAVAVAASTAFATPMASMSTTMVMAPGNYRFGDYAKIGLGFQMLALIIAMVVLPLLFPF